MPRDISVISPVSGATLKIFPTPASDEITVIMAQARDAAEPWAAVPVPARARLCRQLVRIIARDADTIAAAVTACTGKTPVEALATDIYPCLEIMRYSLRRAPRVLQARAARLPLMFGPGTGYVEYRPYGVVLVIAPWNLPFQLSLVPVASAVLAGNAVILKPSEYTLTIGELVAQLFARAGFPAHLVQSVSGDGETGARLIAERPNKIFFTGSSGTGKKVMAAAAVGAIPVDLELGGKDPMIVCADADLERAAHAAVYGAFSNAGQVCVSVERLYVHETVHDAFIARLEEKAAALRVGSGFDDDIGAVTTAPQREIIRAHVEDAVRRGARLHGKLRTEGPYIHPVILSNVTHAMLVMREETFGPVLPVMRFSTEDEAVRLANDSPYGLNASVWTRDLARGRQIARRIQAGNCAVNTVLTNIGNPMLPFGGVKGSGFGRYHADEGLYAFCQPVSITVSARRSPRDINWFPYSRDLYEGLKTFLQVRYAGHGLWAAARRLVAALPRLRKIRRR